MALRPAAARASRGSLPPSAIAALDDMARELDLLPPRRVPLAPHDAHDGLPRERRGRARRCAWSRDRAVRARGAASEAAARSPSRDELRGRAAAPRTRRRADPHRGVQGLRRLRGRRPRTRARCWSSAPGPAGAVVAKELAEAGRDVVLLEEGPPFGAKDFRQEAGESLHRTLREGGTRATRGSIVHAHHAGDRARRRLARQLGDLRALARVGVRQVGRAHRHGRDHARRARSALRARRAVPLRRARRRSRCRASATSASSAGCDALGISSEPTYRNVQGCKGIGRVLHRLPQRRQAVDRRLLRPRRHPRGRARVHERARRARAGERPPRHGHARARRRALHAAARRTRSRSSAKLVVLAAGCMATPVILQRSGARRTRAATSATSCSSTRGSRSWRSTTTRSIPWKGATQGYHSLHLPRGGHQARGALVAARGARRAPARPRPRLPAAPAHATTAWRRST